jgi:hypothetical protein
MKYDVFGELLMAEKEKRLDKETMTGNMTSRRFWVVIIILAVVVFSMFHQYGIQYIPVLSILAGGVSGWLGISTYFKEKSNGGRH